MKVAIYEFTSGDLDDIETFSPEPGEIWCSHAEVALGPEGEAGKELFQFMICSEAYVADALGQGPLPAGRMIIFREYSFAALRASVESVVARYADDSETWGDFARQVNWEMQWEFENYLDESK